MTTTNSIKHTSGPWQKCGCENALEHMEHRIASLEETRRELLAALNSAAQTLGTESKRSKDRDTRVFAEGAAADARQAIAKAEDER